MGQWETAAAATSSTICGSAIISIIKPEQTYLARSGVGRLLVLKRLEADCLMGGQLHPGIRQRLERVRELACTQVANLCGVQRDESGDFLIWDYVEGQTWEEYAREHPDALVKKMGRELKLAVESLHGLGIVHGALHGRNVIVTGQNQVRLTHISPLLYQEPADDWGAVGKLLAEIDNNEPSVSMPEQTDREGTSIRRRTLLLILLVALAGLGIAWAVVHHARRLPSPVEVRP